jgi:hypothetical protein
MLANLRNLPVQLLAFATCAAAWPHLFSRAVINHDAVVGFLQTVPSGLTGSLYLKYKPYLEVYNGCVPFPAVDAAGDTGYDMFIPSNLEHESKLTYTPQRRPRNHRSPQWRLRQFPRPSLRALRNLQ